MDVRNTTYDDIPFFNDLVRFYEESPLTLPGVGIFCCGSAKKMKRLVALVNVLVRSGDGITLSVLWHRYSLSIPFARGISG